MHCMCDVVCDVVCGVPCLTSSMMFVTSHPIFSPTCMVKSVSPGQIERETDREGERGKGREREDGRVGKRLKGERKSEKGVRVMVVRIMLERSTLQKERRTAQCSTG